MNEAMDEENANDFAAIAIWRKGMQALLMSKLW